jgi:hypothetical protein
MTRHADHVHALGRVEIAVPIGNTNSSPPRARTSCMLDLSFSSSRRWARSPPPACRVHQRQRAVLELAGRVGLGVDVGDFLELERAFQRDRVVQPAAEEQRVVLAGELFRPGRDLRLQRSARAARARQEAQLLHALGLALGRHLPPMRASTRSAGTAPPAGW